MNELALLFFCVLITVLIAGMYAVLDRLKGLTRRDPDDDFKWTDRGLLKSVENQVWCIDKKMDPVPKSFRLKADRRAKSWVNRVK